MEKVVTLSLGGGSLDQGFALVTAQVNGLGLRTLNGLKSSGSLPAAWGLRQAYQQWRALYLALQYRLEQSLRIQLEDQPVITNVSHAKFEQLSCQLAQDLNAWLMTESFRKIDQQLRLYLMPQDVIRVIIETDCHQTWQLPWHLWQFFEDYPQAEVALADLNYRPKMARQRPPGPVRILGVLGNATGIDVQGDRRLLEQLTDADTVFLVEPQRAELHQHLWDDRGWDILFFAGHSVSEADGSSGYLALNPTDRLSIEQLRNGLKAAIAKGLQLAILNSCDGLGLARAMADLDIPQMVVMREPVPDPVAQTFLTHFLQAFSTGQSFYQAVREAREKLQGLEDQFLCASWLPIICQHPATQPPTWPELRGQPSAAIAPPLNPDSPAPSTLPAPTPDRQDPSSEFRVPSSAFRVPPSAFHLPGLTLLTTTAILLTRWLGLLEPLELAAFDWMMRQRPQETTDPRIVVVEVTQADTNRYGYPLEDRLLAQALAKLARFQPRAIGLDMHRALPRGQGRSEFLRQFTQQPNLTMVCFGGASDRAFGPPPEFSETQQRQQMGLSDLLPDSDRAGTIRRHLLAVNPELGERSLCATPYSLSLTLAETFLNQHLDAFTSSPLPRRFGGYQHLDGLSNQILINYRAVAPTMPPGQRVTLQEVLEDRIQANWVSDRIVLIGTSSPAGNDIVATPYGEMPGVWVHAHLVSQLLSAHQDQRPLIRTLPQWGPRWDNWQWADGLWVLAWGGLGSAIAVRLSRPWLRGLSLGAGAIAISQLCLWALVQGLWLAWVPAIAAWGLSQGSIYLWATRKPRLGRAKCEV